MNCRAVGMVVFSWFATGCPESGPPAVFRSERLGFTWRLPTGWGFTSDFDNQGPPGGGAAEMKSARKGWLGSVTAQLIVADLVTVIPGKLPEHDRDGVARLEENALTWMKKTGGDKVEAQRLTILGRNAVRVSGVVGRVFKDYVDVTLHHRGRRRIDMRCIADEPGEWWPCDEAFAGLEFVDLPEAVKETDTPRVLHLRDARFGIEYDAPDDGWLGFGPRTGMNGDQSVWIWNEGPRQIDVSGLDVAAMPVQQDEATAVESVARLFRGQGATVIAKKSDLAGRTCSHLEVDAPTGQRQDLFVQKRGTIIYSVLVTQSARDAELLVKARAGLKIRAPGAKHE